MYLHLNIKYKYNDSAGILVHSIFQQNIIEFPTSLIWYIISININGDEFDDDTEPDDISDDRSDDEGDGNDNEEKLIMSSR